MASMLQLLDQQAHDLQEYDKDVLDKIRIEISNLEHDLGAANPSTASDRASLNLQTAKDQYKRKL